MRRTIETEPERPQAEAGRALPFLLAAGLLLGLTVFAHGVVLILAAIAAGPLPAAQTALFLSRKSAASAAKKTALPAWANWQIRRNARTSRRWALISWLRASATFMANIRLTGRA